MMKGRVFNVLRRYISQLRAHRSNKQYFRE